MYTNHNAVRGNNFGTHTVTLDEQTAGTVSITPDITGGETINGAVVTILRSGIQLSGADISYSKGTLTIATNGTDYVVTTGDVINYIVF